MDGKGVDIRALTDCYGAQPTAKLRRRRGAEEGKALLLGEKLELRGVGLGWLF